MRSALRPLWLRVFRMLPCVVTGAVVFVLGLILLARIDLSFRSDLLMWLVLLPPPTAGVLAGAFLRDFLLRRRLRHVIKTRGGCDGCGYVLLGLPVSAADTVQCPECGVTSEVDAAVGELAPASGGVRLLSGGASLPDERFWTPGRIAAFRLEFRWSMVAALILAVAAGVAVLVRLRAVANDAAAASAVFQPGRMLGKGGGNNAAKARIGDKSLAETLVGLVMELDAVARPFLNLDTPAVRVGGTPVYPELNFLSLTFDPELYQYKVPPGSVWHVQQTLNRRVAAAVLDRLAGTDLLRRIDEVPSLAAPVAHVPLSFRPPSMLWPGLDLRVTQELLSLNQARMWVASRSGDSAEMLVAFGSSLALARMPQVVGGDNGFSYEFDLLASLLPMLPGADEPTLAKLTEVIGPDVSSQILLDAIEFGRLAEHQRLAEVFSLPEVTRWGVLSAAAWLGSGLDIRRWYESLPLGRFHANLEEVDETANLAAALAGKRPCDQSFTALQALASTQPGQFFLGQRLELVRLCSFNLMYFYYLQTAQLAVRVRVAVERFQRINGHYPASIGELVPQFLASVPLDPWADAPLRYRVVPQQELSPAGYILYSVGPDRVDNGGSGPGVALFFGVVWRN